MLKPASVRAYALGVVAALGAVFLRWTVDSWLGGERPLAALYGAVALAAWVAGYGPAIVTLLLGYLLSDLLFMAPRGQVTLASPDKILGFALYLCSCGIIIALAHTARRAQRRAHRAELQLRARNDDLHRTIADLEAAEQRLRAGDTRLRVATRIAKMFAWEVDYATHTVHWSDNAAAVIGCKHTDLPSDSNNSFFFVAPGDGARVRDEFAQAVARRQEICSWEFGGHGEDGGARWYLAQAHVQYDPQGRPTRMIGATKDITERKLVEIALSKSEERFRLATSAGAVGVWDWDVVNNVVSWSDSLYAIHGVARETFGCTVESFAALVHPDDRAAANDAIERALRTRGDYEVEFRAVRPDGAVIWIYSQAQVIRNEAGEPVRMVGGTVDVTRRKHAELALLESEAKHRTLTEALPFAVWQTDANGRSEFGNTFMYEYTGLTAATLKDRGWLDALHRDERDDLVRAWERSLRTGERLQVEHRMRRLDGQYRWFQSVGVPVHGADGTIVKWVGASFDIHDRRVAEAALQTSEQQLRHADRRKDEFLATLAHELRNPLAPIRNAVHILRAKGSPDPQLLWARDVIDRQVSQMTRLLEDLLDVSRISRGKIELRKGPVTIAAVIDAAVETSRPLIDEGGHELVISTPSDAIWLNADVVRLAQVFSNLLNNAAKYCDQPGVIRLSAACEGADVIVRVQDSGIGMTHDMLPRVFEMFSQAEASLNRSKGGLGIGLSLAKFLVEAHDGSIAAESAGLGKGSSFIVRLPIASPQLQPERGSDAGGDEAAAPKQRILIADDLKDAAESLAMLLKLMGHEVRTAYDGAQALSAAEAFKPDIAVLDLGMPQLNGFDACRRIKSRPWGKDMVVVAVTGWAQEDDRRRSREAGFDFHLAKPIDTAMLMNIIAGNAERRRRPRNDSTSDPAGAAFEI